MLEALRNRYQLAGLLPFMHGIVALLGASLIATQIWHAREPLGFMSQPLGMDFYCFWSAGRMVLDGNVTGIYDPAVLGAFQRADRGAPEWWSLPWFYPPHLLLFISCAFATLPYGLAYAAYLVISLGAFVLVARRLLPEASLLVSLSFPAFWFNLMSGQNGLLSAVILVLGLLALMKGDRKSDIAAGAILALLSFKPQLCLALPLFLLVERRWTVIASGAVCWLALMALSVAVFGISAWEAFLVGLREAQSYNQLSNRIKPDSLAHLYGTLKSLGLAHGQAMALNYLFAGAAAVAAIRIWLQPAPPTVKYAVVILMSLMLSPHLLYYDLVMTGAVIVWLWPLAHLRPALVVLWLAPILWPFATHFGIAMVPLATAMILYGLIVRPAPATAPA